MEKVYYNTIRENLLNNFLKKNYKYTVIGNMERFINDIKDRCPFQISYDMNTCLLNIILDKTNVVSFTLVLDKRETDFYLKDII